MHKLIQKYRDIPVAAKATLWFMICSILQKGISLITTPIFTRIMSTEQYGQFSVYNSWLQIFTIFTTMRLNWAVFNKGMVKYKNDRDGYTSTMQTITCILTTIVLAVYLIFRKQFNALIELPTFIMLSIFAELYLTPAIDFWSVRKRYEYQYKSVVFRTLIMSFLNAGFGVLAVYMSEEKGYARILTCVAVNVLFGIILFVYNLRKGKKLLNIEYAKFAIGFNLPLFLHYISQYILDQFDRIMIQKMVGIAEAGIYSVAYNVGLIMKIVVTSINNAIVPWQYEKLEKKEFKEYDNTFFLIAVLVGACSVLFSATAPEIMKILADEKYYEAVYVVPPVALSMFFTFAYTAFANVEFFYNQNKFTMYVSMLGAGLNILLNYIFISLFGYIAAAYTTLFCYIVFAVVHYVYMNISVKSVIGEVSIFNSKRLFLLMLAVTLCGFAVIVLYDFILVRYAIILLTLIIMAIKRKKIIQSFKMIKKAG